MMTNECKNYNWLRLWLRGQNKKTNSLRELIAEYGIGDDGRHIGTIREEFKYAMSPSSWAQILKRKQFIADKLKSTIQSGKTKAYMFPIQQEEYSLEIDFLKHAFPLPDFPAFKETETLEVLTIGSCFAENIAKRLREMGMNATNAHFAEDVNSPISLLSLLKLINSDFSGYLETVEQQLVVASSEDPTSFNEHSIRDYIDEERKRILHLRQKIKKANILIITFGNTLEWSHTFNNNSIKLDPRVGLGAFNHKIKGVPRMRMKAVRQQAPYNIIKRCIIAILSSLREQTSCPIICTVSPIPIRGINAGCGTKHRSAITENNICKSKLRAALDEAISGIKATQTYYFPAFEIASDVSARIPKCGYGNDDSNSRHLDTIIIQSICEFFIWKISKS